MKQPLFLEPVLKERIWGGTALKDKFGYHISSNSVGECWGISGHPNGESVVKNGSYKGKNIQEIWTNSPELFGNPNYPQFPILTKILDANDDLSVQVHPNDIYAREHENGELGKTECWYVIDCEEDAEIVYGHNVDSKEELIEKINKQEWDSLLNRIKIEPGNFFYVPSGTVHAICKGTLILEVQQSSDTTYRVYDYDRVDENGNTRELHLEKAIDVITIPNMNHEIKKDILNRPGYDIINFLKSDYFSVYKWDIKESFTCNQDKSFMACSVVNGAAELESATGKYELGVGEHFILPYNFGKFNIKGNIEIIMAHI